MDCQEGYQGSPSCRCYSVSCWPSFVQSQKHGIELDPALTTSSDFETKFVCGEIMAYEDLKEYGTEAQVKAAGKLRQQGKPYEIVDGDICYWKSGQ
jgi:ribosome-binding ATPase YchF (GTP1/OBG family)